MAFVEFTHNGFSESGKTLIVDVKSKDETTVLGQIRWFGRWRKYCFFPECAMVFDSECLLEISLQCSRMTQQHKLMHT